MLDDNHPIARLIPKEKRSDELEQALNGLGATDMGTLADALVAGYNAKTKGDALQAEVTELKETMDDMVFIPDENTAEEEVKLYYEKAGVPGSIVEYDLNDMAASDEGRGVLNAFLEAKVPKKSAKIVAEKLAVLSSNQAAANETRLTEVKASLGEKGYDLAVKGADILYPGEENQKVREKFLKDPDAIPGLSVAGKVGIENGKLFQKGSTGGGGVLYPSMEKRGIK